MSHFCGSKCPGQNSIFFKVSFHKAWHYLPKARFQELNRELFLGPQLHFLDKLTLNMKIFLSTVMEIFKNKSSSRDKPSGNKLKSEKCSHKMNTKLRKKENQTGSGETNRERA